MKFYFKKRKKFWITLLILLIGFGFMQFTTKPITHPPVVKPFQGPKEVMNILRRSCYDCHSNETNLIWYDRLAPASWLVSKDVENGRKALNFSTWGKLSAKQQSGALYNMINFVMLGAMPLPSYLKLHGNAKVSKKEIEILKTYVLSQTPQLKSFSDTLNLPSPGGLQAVSRQLEANLSFSKSQTKLTHPTNVSAAPNGIQYPRGYGNWELISTTDRFDNNTIRAIYGNSIAINAIQENKIQPWPDGAILAKVLWKRNLDSNGLIIAGEFIHAEFMIKNAVQYASTDGWGWARWVGKDLKPYGGTPAFTAECTNCHAPVKDFDFVYTMPIKLQK